jgi:hypothetical protein
MDGQHQQQQLLLLRECQGLVAVAGFAKFRCGNISSNPVKFFFFSFSFF